MQKVVTLVLVVVNSFTSIVLNIMFVLVALLGAPLLYADLGASLSLQEPHYRTSSEHLEYAHPTASKQGELRLASFTRFNSLNPYLTKGIAPSGLGNTLETLAVSTLDDPYTIYGLLAERFDYHPEVYTLYAHLAPNIRFHNGQLVTAQDMVRCFCLLRDFGHPSYARYFRSIVTIEALNDRSLAIYYRPGSTKQDQLFVLKSLPVFAPVDDFAHYTEQPLIGTGPYRIVDYRFGKRIRYARDLDYWGAQLALNQGRHNFDSIKYQVYSDDVVALSAFKSHYYDFHLESVAKLWHTAYHGPAFDNNAIRKELIDDNGPQSMQAFVMNLRNSLFHDIRVRKALNLAFDFPWLNTNMFYDSYTRTTSFFQGTDFAAPTESGVPFLKRARLLQAKQLLDQAGWIIKDGKRVHKDSFKPFEFTVLITSPSFSRICLPYKKILKRLGIIMHIRLVSPSAWIRAVRDFNYDMTTYVWPTVYYPGGEQYMFWHSSSASVPGSYNIIGVQNTTIDKLVEAVQQTDDFASLQSSTRQLDEVLQSQYYVISHWYSPHYRVAYWRELHHPVIHPSFGLDLSCWWYQSVT